ncbi:beta strand repeat-containing protein, partial [Aquimarina rhabdastrellae]
MKYKYNQYIKKMMWALFVLFGLIETKAQDIHFTFANARNTNDGVDDFYEVDVMIQSTVDFKLGSGQLYFNYNPEAFGTNIDGNNTVVPVIPDVSEYTQPENSITGAKLFGGALNVYNGFVDNNNTATRYSVSFQQGVNLSLMDSQSDVTTTPKRLFHLKIKYLDITKEPRFTFEEGALFGGQFVMACEGIPCSGSVIAVAKETFDSSGGTIDSTSPNAICQDITIQLDATGNVILEASQLDNGSTDNVAIADFSVTPTSFDCTHIGNQSVIFTVTDTSGNIANCTATVTIEDKVAPTVTTQDITVQLDATGNVSITTSQIDNGSTDACGIATMSLNTIDFDCSNIGTNTVMLTVTDNNGNTANANATVTIEDKAAPTVVTQDITVQLDATGNASITTSQIDNGSTDACGIATMSLNTTDFDCSNIGTNTVMLTVTDNNGNTASENATVTIEDKVAPTVTTQNITVQLDATGNVSITTSQIDNGSTDACGIATMSLNTTDFDCSNIGVNTVMLTVTDNNGNTASGNARVTIEDKVAPTVTTQNITVQLDATGNASITTSQIDNGSTDACGIATMSLNTTDFDCSNIGTNTVMLTVTDNNGNTASANATVTIEDKVAPTVVTQDITVQLDATGNVSITTSQIDNGSTDACGIATMSLNITDFDCSNIGVNTVMLTVTDNNGNTASANARVTIEDKVAPTVFTQYITVQLDATGNVSITTSQIDNGSTDACGIATMSLNTTDFDCSNIGTNTVMLTVTDNNGNTASANATVTIEDKVAPTVVTQDITVQLDATGNVSITTSQIDNGSTDACGIATMSLNITDFDCSNIGVNTVMLTVTDNNGNTASANARVTIEDKVAPTVVTQDITVQLDATGNVSITTSQIDNGSTDACGIATMSLNTTDFDCSNIGTNTVMLTV